ncbi:MAG: glutathione S-transferase family protein [Rhizobium sp.]|nr:glutathione S-transferase family protein [Rhizobium sp.]
MIDLYSSTTPNVLKVILMLEETGLDYTLKPVNVWKGEQFEPTFVALNPNSKVPVIVDHDDPDGPYAVFESVAILIYLAEKTGRFLPAFGRARHDVMQWLIFQAANIGPANGQFNHFERFAGPGNDYSMSRYTTELKRLYGVMERRLGETPYLGGNDYSIADMATFPWVLIQSRRLGASFPFLDRNSGHYADISAWLTRCEERPDVQRALAVHAKMTSAVATATSDDLDRMFGRGSFAFKG